MGRCEFNRALEEPYVHTQFLIPFEIFHKNP